MLEKEPGARSRETARGHPTSGCCSLDYPMSYRWIALEVEEDGIAVLTINRPEKRNALSGEVELSGWPLNRERIAGWLRDHSAHRRGSDGAIRV